MIGTGFAAVTSQLVAFMVGAKAPTKFAYVAAFVYLVGAILSFYLPEQDINRTERD